MPEDRGDVPFDDVVHTAAGKHASDLFHCANGAPACVGRLAPRLNDLLLARRVKPPRFSLDFSGMLYNVMESNSGDESYLERPRQSAELFSIAFLESVPERGIYAHLDLGRSRFGFWHGVILLQTWISVFVAASNQ
jgi:hypothetical protein